MGREGAGNITTRVSGGLGVLNHREVADNGNKLPNFEVNTLSNSKMQFI